VDPAVTISGHITGVMIGGFSSARLSSATITSNDLGVSIHPGSQATCNPININGNDTDISSDCPYCQK